jgi:hypothetical protein
MTVPRPLRVFLSASFAVKKYVTADYRDSYLVALSFGYKMDHSFRVLAKAAGISKHLNISLSEVFKSLNYSLYFKQNSKG